jgi:hypothetical protein
VRTPSPEPVAVRPVVAKRGLKRGLGSTADMPIMISDDEKDLPRAKRRL